MSEFCWLFASNTPNELLERIQMGHAKIHVMKILQLPRKFQRCFDGIQDHWNDRTSPPHELVEKSLNFLILPRAETTLAYKYRCRAYTFNLLAKCRLPRSPRPDLFFIQPWL